jgi:hypothetical protein
MATNQVSILGNIQPDSTGRCWMEPYDVIASNDLFRGNVIRFKDPTTSQSHGFYGWFAVPPNYVTTAVIIPVWTTTVTTGNCRWRFSYRTVGGDDTTSMDQATFEEQVRIADVAPGAAHRRLTPPIALTSANFTASETVEYLFERQDLSSDDTMVGDAVLFDLIFQYSDT